MMRHLSNAVAATLITSIMMACPASTAHAAEPTRHPRPIVAGFETADLSSPSSLIAAGELLLGELGCTNCHTPPPQAQGRIHTKFGPYIETANTLLRHDWIETWLKSPHNTKPGTTMPDMMGGMSEAERSEAARSILTFLFLNSPTVSRGPQPVGDITRGRELFHTMGCVACHEPEAGYAAPNAIAGVAQPAIQFHSKPLGQSGAKYRREWLADYIQHPIDYRPSGLMPDLGVSDQEAADLAAYLIPKENPDGAWLLGAVADDDEQTLRNASRAGAALISSLGCANCHQIGSKQLKRINAKPLTELVGRTDFGCLDKTPGKGIPHYTIDDNQRRAMAMAITYLPSARPLNASAAAMRLMTVLNCQACHERDNAGGPEPGRAVYFDSTEELGDEGRFPPRLTGVGAKLLPAALEQVINGQGAVRPYMLTRMPSFGANNAAMLSNLFIEADYHPKPLKLTKEDGMKISDDQLFFYGRNMYGRQLVGIPDENSTGAMGCITCHDLRGERSLGVRALDLAHVYERLRPEWFLDYLRDPASLRPGTRMPNFFPEGVSTVKSVLKGNAYSQIAGIWVYLKEIQQSRLPNGLEGGADFEIKVDDQPIVFRTFIQGAGTHGIAVGFKQNIHAAFDSENVRWALAWRGRFLDAESTWQDRFTPLAKILSDDSIALPNHPPLTLTNQPPTPAPALGQTQDGYQFVGYKLNADGTPVFRYRFADLNIEDTLEPTHDGRSLIRRLTITGTPRPLTYHTLNGDTQQIKFTGDEAVVEELLTW